MPIQKALRTYQIRNLNLTMDRQGMYLTLTCPEADAYLLCFTKGKSVVCENLDLSEEELNELCRNQAIIDKGEYRLQGVRSRAFHTASQYRGFRAVPPEQIQVWAMSYDRFHNITTLHFPERSEDQLVFIPMRYSFECRRNDAISSIKITMLDQGVYEDGALMYKVGGASPIPIPRGAVGREIRVLNPVDERIQIVTDDKYGGRYKQAR